MAWGRKLAALGIVFAFVSAFLFLLVTVLWEVLLSFNLINDQLDAYSIASTIASMTKSSAVLLYVISIMVCVVAARRSRFLKKAEAPKAPPTTPTEVPKEAAPASALDMHSEAPLPEFKGVSY